MHAPKVYLKCKTDIYQTILDRKTSLSQDGCIQKTIIKFSLFLHRKKIRAKFTENSTSSNEKHVQLTTKKTSNK